MIQVFRHRLLVRQYSYGSEQTRKIITSFMANRERVDDPLPIAIKAFNSLQAQGCRFGIEGSRQQFGQFLTQVEQDLKARMGKLTTAMPMRRIQTDLVEIAQLYRIALDIQLQNWTGTLFLVEWLQHKVTQNLFVHAGQPMVMLRYFNMLDQNGVDVGVFDKNIRNLVDHFSYKGVHNPKDVIEWLYGIRIVRQMSQMERDILKSGLVRFSKMSDSLAIGGIQQVLGEYIGMSARVFYPSVISSLNMEDGVSDLEDEKLDEEVDRALLRCYETLLNQDALQYNSMLLQRELDDEVEVGPVDPMNWRTLSNASLGLQALASNGSLTQDNTLHRLEKAIERKLETDVAHVSYGTHISSVLQRFSHANPDVVMRILHSLCEQLRHEQPDRIALNNHNIPILLSTLLRLEHYSGSRSGEFIAPGIAHLLKNITNGVYDNQMRQVDWYDVQEVASQFKLDEFRLFCSQKLQV